MIIQLERTVPFPRDAVYAWWTDFQEDDHPGRPSPATSRRAILRREGNEVWLRDRATRPGFVTVEEHLVLEPPNGYAVTARYPGAEVLYRYEFEEIPGGTKILLTAQIHARHAARMMLPLFLGWIQRYAERDTEYHIARMGADLNSPASSPGRPH